MLQLFFRKYSIATWNAAKPSSLLSYIIVSILMTLTLVQCSTPSSQPPPFRIVGYLPSWSGDVEKMPYTNLTHINYAFLRPNPDGSLQPVENHAKLQRLVTYAHTNGVIVLIAVGGWSGGPIDTAFESLAANPSARATFCDALVRFVEQYQLDGIDIDWEYPRVAADFAALMRELRQKLPQGKLLTAAVVSEGEHAAGITPEVFDSIDWLNIMAYDGGEPHANIDWTIASLQFWLKRGLPSSKAVLGVPFYARPGESFTYAEAVAADSANAQQDCATVRGRQGCYNGIETIRKKTEYAIQHAAGIMVWELSQDTADETSLIATIAATARAHRGQ
jgi:chitinase